MLTMTATRVLSLGDPVYMRVREALRQDIVDGVFPGGTRIKMAELAQRYAVSAMPVREALQELQGEGLVIIEPNKGARVRTVDAAFIHNMYDIRGAIDAMLVRRAAAALSAGDLKLLAQSQSGYEASAKRGELAAVLAENQRFHGIINRAAANPEAEAMISRHWSLIDALRGKYGFAKQRLAETVREHRSLLAALEARDVDAAQRIALGHVEHAKNDLLACMRGA